MRKELSNSFEPATSDRSPQWISGVDWASVPSPSRSFETFEKYHCGRRACIWCWSADETSAYFEIWFWSWNAVQNLTLYPIANPSTAGLRLPCCGCRERHVKIARKAIWCMFAHTYPRLISSQISTETQRLVSPSLRQNDAGIPSYGREPTIRVSSKKYAL